jgi:hypothetical protein
MAVYPKDVFELVLQDMHGEQPDQTNPEVQAIQKYIAHARSYFLKNQPVSHRVGIESAFILQLQDNQVVPFCNIPMEETGQTNGAVANVSSAGVRSNETTRSPSWGVTGQG